jgi:hypothetical protein
MYAEGSIDKREIKVKTVEMGKGRKIQGVSKCFLSIQIFITRKA